MISKRNFLRILSIIFGILLTISSNCVNEDKIIEEMQIGNRWSRCFYTMTKSTLIERFNEYEKFKTPSVFPHAYSDEACWYVTVRNDTIIAIWRR